LEGAGARLYDNVAPFAALPLGVADERTQQSTFMRISIVSAKSERLSMIE
jgi:hypothetical protein